MNFLIFIYFWFTVFIKKSVCQALADSKSNYINFYKEMLYPAFRRHRARIRPNNKNRGSPINKIRGSRNVRMECKIIRSYFLSNHKIFIYFG